MGDDWDDDDVPSFGQQPAPGLTAVVRMYIS